MERTWRWFGKNDKITLAMLKQIGVEGIVTALHDVPLGEVWTREKIRDLREYIESYGMRWSVVESLPVVETIKYAGPDRDEQIEVYKQSLRNLAAEGIHTICSTTTPTEHRTSTSTMPSLPISTSIYSNAKVREKTGPNSSSRKGWEWGATCWRKPTSSPRP